MEVIVNLAQNIYNQLVTDAESKGLTIEELIKMILGGYANYVNPKPIPPIPFHNLTFPDMPDMQSITDKLTRMGYIVLNIVLKQLASTGALKCSECTLTLTSEALEKGECNNCRARL